MRTVIALGLLLLMSAGSALAVIPEEPNYSTRWTGFTGLSVVDSYLVCGSRTGIVVFERTATPELGYERVTVLPLATAPIEQKLAYPYVILRNKAQQLYIIDVSNLPEVSVVATLDITFPFEDFVLDDSTLYISMGFDGLWRYRLHDMSDPELLDSSVVGVHYTDLELDGDTLLVLDDYNGMLRYTVSDSAAPVFVDHLYVPFQVVSFNSVDSLLVMLLRDSRMFIADLSVSPPIVVDSFESVLDPSDLIVVGRQAILFDTLNKYLEVIDINTGRDNFTSSARLPVSPQIGDLYDAEPLDYLLYPTIAGGIVALDLQALYFGPITPIDIVSQGGPISGMALLHNKLFVGGPINPLDMYRLANDGEPLATTTLYSGLTEVASIDQQGDSIFVIYPQIRRSLTLEIKPDTNIFRGTLYVDTSKYRSIRLNPGKIDSLRSFFAIGTSRLDIYTISDSGDIALTNYINIVGTITDVELVDSIIVLASTKTLRFYRLYNNFAIEYRSQLKFDDDITEMRAHAHRLMVFGSGDVAMLDISTPVAPVIDTTIRLSRNYYATDVDGDLMYAVSPEDLAVFDMTGTYPLRLDMGGRGGYFITAFNGIAAVSDSFGIHIYDLRNIQTDVTEDSPWRPESFSLDQNYPNPFNPNTTIRYQLPRRSLVSLTIYNLLGQEVRRLVNSELTAGEYRVEWDGTDDGGHIVSTGIYFYRLEVGSIAQTRKMLLVK
ncbi:MAG: T9SS type A sorting domain-containing protein [candidate division Zixibacteria bacterium]|nr:T9SS type A sorting domain-containing protein [candidate division Zixibacteria bacterium]